MDNKKKNNPPFNSDVDKEDLNALGEKTPHLRTDGGSDEQLRDREEPVDFTGKGLDIPGRTLPSERGKKVKDEENQHYSLGSADNDQLEQGKDG